MKRPIIPKKNLLLQKINLPPKPKALFWTKKKIIGIILMFLALSIPLLAEKIAQNATIIEDETYSIMADYVQKKGDISTYRHKYRRKTKILLPYLEVLLNFNDFFYKDCMEIKFETNNFSESAKIEINNMLKSKWNSVHIKINDSVHTPKAFQVNIYLEGLRHSILGIDKYLYI